MAWASPAVLLQQTRSLESLRERLTDALGRLSNLVRCYEPVGALVYGTSILPGGDLSRQQLIEVTNGTAFTIENPRSPREGVEIVLDIYNNSGGAMGAITWGSEYEMAGAMTNPATGTHRLIAFYRTKDGAWRELYRSSANVS
jgi:hypothetical protein